MTALAKLPEKWRAAAQALRDNPSYYVEIRSRGVAAAYDNCADELTASLSPAELGGVEAVAWLVESELAGKVSAELYEAAADNAIADVVKEYGTAYGATTKRPLYTTPASPATGEEWVCAKCGKIGVEHAVGSATHCSYEPILAAAPQPQEVTVSDVCAALDRIPLSERKPPAECQCAKCDSSGELHWRCTCVKDPSITCIVHPRKPRDLQWLEDAAEDAEQLTTPPAHGDGEAINPHFWVQAIRTNAHVTDCKEKTQVLLNAADALAIYLTTRPTPEAQEANWVNDLWNRRRAEAADLDKGEEFAKGKAAGIRSVLVEVVMFVTKGAALALPAQGEGK